MKLNRLLQTDFRVQEIVSNLSQNLGPNECIFAISIPFGYNFKIVRESRKRWFRFINRPFKPVFITDRPKAGDSIKTVGKLIELRYKQS